VFNVKPYLSTPNLWDRHSIIEIGVIWLGAAPFSFIFTWIYNITKSLLIVMLFHAALNHFVDLYENIFPTLVNLDKELPFFAC